MITRTKIHKTYNYILRAVIVVATYGFLYKQIFYKRNLQEIFDSFGPLIQTWWFWLNIFFIFLLMLLNWGLESWKWKFLISKLEKITFIKSYEGVLTGVSVSAFTPNRVGEYFGRVFILEKANRIEGILVTIVGSISQLLTTIIFGLFCSMYLVPFYAGSLGEIYVYVYYGMILVVPMVVFLLLLLYFNISLLPVLLDKILKKNKRKWMAYIQVFKAYTSGELLYVLLLSMIRFIVFTLQFYWLLKLFHVDLPFIPAMLIIPVVFFLITIVPSVTIAELGIRGVVSIFVISIFFKTMGTYTGVIDIGIFASTSFLWLINLVIPALMGTIFVFKLKFFRK